MISIYSRKTGIGLCAVAWICLAPLVHGQPSPVSDREIYTVELARDSRGRLFLAPGTEPSAGTGASAIHVFAGTILSKTTAGEFRVVFDVLSEDGFPVHTLDLTKEVEIGATPFAFEWPILAVVDGDYRARVRVLDRVLGEEANVEWVVSLRNRAVVEQDVERARELLTALRDAHPDLSDFAEHRIRRALEALAPYPASHRPLIEADLNARFARSVAGSVRARLALAPSGATHGSEMGTNLYGPMRGGVVLTSAERLAGLGFSFTPYVVNPDKNFDQPIDAGNGPAMVWIAGEETEARLDRVRALAPGTSLGKMAAVSLWTAPSMSMMDKSMQQEFQTYLQSVYPDRHALNRAWNTHYFGFNEVQLMPYNENRAYQYDAQSFRRIQTTRWLAEQLRAAAPGIAPAAATLTFTEGILLSGESRAGLDAESLAALVPVVSVRTAGPFDDARYAQRFPATQLVWALMRAFAPDRPLVALHSLNYTLDDRRRLDSAAQARTLAIEAAVENVSALALEFPALTDAVSQAPEVLDGFAQALREIEGAADAFRAFHEAPAPLAVVWSDSSKILDDGKLHLHAFARAYEGCAFAGDKVTILTERQLAEGRWTGIRAVVLPEVTAMSREAFAGLESLIAGGAVVVRTDVGPTYDEHGHALGKTMPVNSNTMLVRGNGPVYEYLSALDALHVRGHLDEVPRPVTEDHYPIEGVKSRYAQSAAGRFLYVINLRKEPVSCHFSQPVEGAVDILSGRTVDFPRPLDPLSPLLLRLANTEQTD